MWPGWLCTAASVKTAAFRAFEIMRIPTPAPAFGPPPSPRTTANKRLLRGTPANLPSDTVWRTGEEHPAGPAEPGRDQDPERWLHHRHPHLQHRVQPQGRPRRLRQFEDRACSSSTPSMDARSRWRCSTAQPSLSWRFALSGHFDFEAKYTKGQTEHFVPAPIDPIIAATAQQHAEIAYRTVGLSGVAPTSSLMQTGHHGF